MKFNSLTLCEKALIDSQTNTLSLINIIEEIQVKGLPAIIQNLTIVLLLKKEEGDNEQKYIYEIVLKNNSIQLAKQQVNIDFLGKSKFRLIVNFKSFLIKEQGSLIVEILDNGISEISSSTIITLPAEPEAIISK